MATEKKKTEEELAAEAANALAGLTYQKSDAVTAAERELADYSANKPGEYTSAYQQKIDSLLEDILNRPDFSYSFDADPLYQQYKDQYTHAGRLAMQDAAAGAAGATGGYGSSYAAAAGSGAYQAYLNRLNEQLPELYGKAQDTYNSRGTAMQDSLSALTAQEKQAQAAYEGRVADYYKGLSAATDAADSAYQKDYTAYRDTAGTLGELRDYYAAQQQQAVKNAQAQSEYELALKKYEESVRQWEAEQAAAEKKWQAQLDAGRQQAKEELAYKLAALNKSTAKTTADTTEKAAGTTPEKTTGTATAKKPVPVLSESAQQVRAQIARELALLEAEHTSTAQRALRLQRMLDAYYKSGTISKTEQKYIAAAYGVTL